MRFEKALVVDDEPISRAVLRHVLEVGGLEVVEASDGHEAMEVARRAEPDLVLTDIRMPGLSGRELAEKLRDDPGLAQMTLIAVTRHPDEARNGGSDPLFDLVMPKPVSASRLWRWLQSAD